MSAINKTLNQTEGEVLLNPLPFKHAKRKKTMKIKELQRNLLEAYNAENLNGISLTLINLYKNQQFSILQNILQRKIHPHGFITFTML